MRSSLVLLLTTALVLCLALASCTLITEVDRGLIDAGGAGGLGGSNP
jgi:hypothetical protein